MAKFIELHGFDKRPYLLNAEWVECVCELGERAAIRLVGVDAMYEVIDSYQAVKDALQRD